MLRLFFVNYTENDQKFPLTVMKKMKRKEFLKTTVKAGGAAFTAPLFIPNFLSEKPSDRVNVAVIGLTDRRPSERGIRRGRGLRHVEGYSQLENVRVTAVCDVVERLFPDFRIGTPC
jgi:hypothetical protein